MCPLLVCVCMLLGIVGVCGVCVLHPLWVHRASGCLVGEGQLPHCVGNVWPRRAAWSPHAKVHLPRLSAQESCSRERACVGVSFAAEDGVLCLGLCTGAFCCHHSCMWPGTAGSLMYRKMAGSVKCRGHNRVVPRHPVAHRGLCSH